MARFTDISATMWFGPLVLTQRESWYVESGALIVSRGVADPSDLNDGITYPEGKVVLFERGETLRYRSATAAQIATLVRLPAFAEAVDAGAIGGGSGGGAGSDRELIVTTYRVKTAFTGASVGDTITATQVIDVTGPPITVSTIWRNQTTAADLGAAPAAANLELLGAQALTDAQLRAAAIAVTDAGLGTDGGTPPAITGTGVRGWLRSIYERLGGTLAVSGPLTDDQLRAAAVAVAPNITRGGGAIDANTQRVTLATDGPVVVGVGTPADAAAASDGTGNYGIIAGIKRGLLNWATLLTRIPAQIVPGLLPVDTLATPAVPRVQATTAAAASIVLTATCRRISIYATAGTWYSLTGAATVTSHYIGAGERLDLNVPAGTTISVLRETADGSVRITELV
jgi:hypothetical protein